MVRVRWFVAIAASALLIGLVAGLLWWPDGGASDAATSTTTTMASTTTTVPLTADAVLADALRTASLRLTGRSPSADDVSAFIGQYHQAEVDHSATTPAAAADAYVRLHHPAEVTAYGYLRQAKCSVERLLPGGDNADCDKAKPKGKSKG